MTSSTELAQPSAYKVLLKESVFDLRPATYSFSNIFLIKDVRRLFFATMFR